MTDLAIIGYRPSPKRGHQNRVPVRISQSRSPAPFIHMWIVRLALRRPYTFVVMAVLIAILGVSAILTMPVDIFPFIDIPVVSVIWGYGGLSPEEMEKRMVTIFERAMTTTVN